MATWQVRVDWNGDGDFADANEDITADVMDVSWRLGMHKPYQNVADEAIATIKLENTDGKYHLDNVSGAVYGNIKPRRRVQVNYVSGGTTTMYQGFLDSLDYSWQPGPAGGYMPVTMTCVGLKKYLDKTEIDVGLLREKRADEIIERILLYAPVLPVINNMWVLGSSTYSVLGDTTILNSLDTFTDLDDGISTFEFFGDTSTHRSVQRAADGDKLLTGYKAIKDAVEAERGRFFQARDGKAEFWNRNHMALVNTIGGTVDSNGSYKPRAVKYEYGPTFCNNVEVIPHQRAEGALQTLWNLESPIEIRGGQTVAFNADYTDVNGQECGAEWARIGALEYSGGTVATGIKPLGIKAEIKLENTSPADTATITGLTIEGPILTSNNRLIAYAENNTSINTYEKTETLRLNLPALEDYAVAQRVARFEVRRRSTPRIEVLSVSFLNDSTAGDDAHQVMWKIGTKIRVKLDEIYHDAEYFIMGEDHSLSDGLKVHQTTFWLERADNNALWVLGVSELGIDTVLGI